MAHSSEQQAMIDQLKAEIATLEEIIMVGAKEGQYCGDERELLSVLKNELRDLYSGDIIID